MRFLDNYILSALIELDISKSVHGIKKYKDKTNLKNKLKDREKTVTKTEDTKPRSSSKQRPIFKAENKFEILEYMEMDEELDTKSATNSNKKHSQKTTKKPKKPTTNSKY